MKMYWTLKSIPELSGASWRERGRRWRRASSKSLRHFTTQIALLLPAFGGGFGAYYSQKFDWGVWGGTLGGALGGFLFAQVSIAVARKHYRHILLGKEVEPSAEPDA
jgi:hypothetical protein